MKSFTMLVAVLALGLSCLSAPGIAIEDVVAYAKTVQALAMLPEFRADFDAHVQRLLKAEPHYYDYSPLQHANLTFDCDVSCGGDEPTSVHKLRPCDVNVVGALGDSLTAALGSKAKKVSGLTIEYRGTSWSMGGDDELETLVTMPNVLKKFNRRLEGCSVGQDLLLTTPRGVRFNAAVSGQKANHIPQQARELVDRLRADKRVNFERDWKLITLFIGGNDVCGICNHPEKYSPANYIAHIQHGLDILYKELPRALVNLVVLFNVANLKYLNVGSVCSALHYAGCRCPSYPATPHDEFKLVEDIKLYQNYTEQLVATGRYDGREDFTVVVQPFFRDFQLPRLPNKQPDMTYFAPDCFHFSLKGQASAATGLWNNLLQREGQKTTYKPGDRLQCPTKKNPYFFTRKNSKNV